MIAAGIDCGSKTTKAIIIHNNSIIGRGMVPTGSNQKKAVEASLHQATAEAGLSQDDIQRIGGTGAVKNAINIADANVDDIQAMAKGANFFFPAARTVADVGAQEGRAAKIDENGKPLDFAINEECAAGAGAFIDAMARALEVTTPEMGALCLKSNKDISMNAQCVIFAESEVVRLIHVQTDKADISKAIHDSMAGQIGSIIRRIGINEDVALIGGVGKNPGFIAAMLRELKLEKIYIPNQPEYGAAVGAALVAAQEGKQESWRWPESNWKNPDIVWNDDQHITAGIDVGSVSSQAVIMADGQILAYSSMRTGSDSSNSALKAFKSALAASDMPESRLDYCIGTGYGRVNVPFADRTISEIACHARGANFFYGSQVRTVVDVGGQDIKAIQCDERGKVANFLMNDKCAAGTGRGMEVMADLLGVPVTEIGDKSFQYQGGPPEAISSACVVYARSEAMALLRQGRLPEEVLAAYCQAMADRIYALVEKLGIKAEFAVTGGMAKNCGVMDRLETMIGMDRMKTEWDPQIAGAVGAALFAHKLCQKGKGRKKR